MVIFDNLDHLEDYLTIIPDLSKVIDTLDRSEPYDKEKGVYEVEGTHGKKYVIEVLLTSKSGKEEHLENEKIIEIALEGSELVSISNDLFFLTPGFFAYYETKKGEKLVRGISKNEDNALKVVRFFL